MKHRCPLCGSPAELGLVRTYCPSARCSNYDAPKPGGDAARFKGCRVATLPNGHLMLTFPDGWAAEFEVYPSHKDGAGDFLGLSYHSEVVPHIKACDGSDSWWKSSMRRAIVDHMGWPE